MTLTITVETEKFLGASTVKAPRLYIPSSGKNPLYAAAVARARAAPYEVHDWSDPPFRSWGVVDPRFQSWTVAEYAAALRRSAGRDHYDSYVRAIQQCDACALLLPAGTDAHAEAMMVKMLGKPVIVCFTAGVQRELCHCAFDHFADGVDAMFELLAKLFDREVGAP